MSTEKFRLVTRSDFDGLVCAVLLKKVGIINEIQFVHPKDMQDGKVAISAKDITTNLPFVPEAHLAFDHHHSETIRNRGDAENHIIDGDAPSEWVVFDGSGRMLGSVTTPAGLEVTEIGEDFVLGIWRDELDVQHVQLYELMKGTTAGG